MKILIDADGCPVVDLTIEISKIYQIQCIIICDTSHIFERDGIQTITVSKGADSVDFKLVNLSEENDIIITQDYGVAAMGLARKSIIINQDGMIYNDTNILELLTHRHVGHTHRRQLASIYKKNKALLKRYPNNKKRKLSQDEQFQKTLISLLKHQTSL